MFDAIVFAITDLGFVARSAREEDDGGDFRLAKIQRIIEQCRYGVHDISAVKLDTKYKLPRFNMPLELGLFLGCKRYGGNRQRHKISLIFDADPYRYQIFISDIAGQDIHCHSNDAKTAMQELRTWLATASRRTKLPGGKDIFERYERFQADLPALCKELKLEDTELTFKDLRQMMAAWLKQNR
ncbi:hypothetical protein F183_A50230 [Bryobacterales bacterium F-183]|nr:hypothetical protein F183_A50230 [Bryobacterales bacterium F-183]